MSKVYPFREQLLEVLKRTRTDEELKAEIHKLWNKEFEKEVPFLMRSNIKTKALH